MLFAQVTEDEEGDCPDADEEDEDEDDDTPNRCVLRGPEVSPIAAVRRREPVILEDDGDEEPHDDLTAEQGFVEGGDFAGLLAIVVRQAEE